MAKLSLFEKRRRRVRTSLFAKRGLRPRLTIHRSGKHIYAQVIDPASRVLASASTLEADIRKEVGNGRNVKAAAAVGKRIAEKAKAQGVEQVAFDRAGFKYHGRVKALAEAARAAGLKF